MTKATRHLMNIKVNDEYGTPPLLFFEASKKFKISPKVDYAASDVNHLCDKYYTMKDNSLLQTWNESGYLNPPYSKVEQFMRKAYHSWKQNNIDLLILVYAKTDTKWWHNYVEGKAEYHFIKGRVKFLDNNGDVILDKHGREQSSPYPSVWIIYRRITTSRDFEMKQMFGD